MDRKSLVQLPPALTAPAQPSQARYVMGIDVGATAAVAALLDVADEVLARAGVAQEQLAAAVLAVAGTDTAAIARKVQSRRSEQWIVVNDVVGAWAAATGGRPGVGAISGTGSNVFGVGPAGHPWRVGGWGHLLGDQGSGYWFGTESIRAALADRDGSGPPTALFDAAVDFFKVPSVEALAALVYSKPLTKPEIAAFAVQTCELAQGGDAVAGEIYARGARELGAQIVAVIGHVQLAGQDDRAGRAGGARGEEFPVGLIGSGFRAGSIFIDPIAAAVHAVAPRARIAVVDMAPVGGSLQLAARACGRSGAIDRGELKRTLDTALA